MFSKASAKLTLYAHNLRIDSEILNSHSSLSAEPLPVQMSLSADSTSSLILANSILLNELNQHLLYTCYERLF